MINGYWATYTGANDKYKALVKGYKDSIDNIKRTYNKESINDAIIGEHKKTKAEILKLKNEYQTLADNYVEKMKNTKSDEVKIHLTQDDKILFALERNNKLLLAQIEIKSLESAELIEYYKQNKGNKDIELMVKAELTIRGKEDPTAQGYKIFLESDSKKTNFDILEELHRSTKINNDEFVTSQIHSNHIENDLGQDVTNILGGYFK